MVNTSDDILDGHDDDAFTSPWGKEKIKKLLERIWAAFTWEG